MEPISSIDIMEISDTASIPHFINKNGPMAVALDVTNACNFHCLHCFNNSGSKRNNELSNEEILDVARQIAEFNCITVCLCGGEPMSRSNIFEIVECISNKTGYLNMVSNGSLISKAVASNLKKSGLYLLQISLDGINSMQHDTLRGHEGAFKKAVSAIEYAKEAGLKTITSFVPNRLNYKTIDKYIDFCFKLGVSEVRAMPMIPMGRGSKLGPLTMNSEEYIEFQQVFRTKKREYQGKGLMLEWGDPIDHYIRMPNNDRLGMKTYCMEIKSDGSLTVSTYLPIIVGNVRNHSLKEYWDNGYDTIWGNAQIQEYMKKIENIYDFDKFEPKPYSDEVIDLDLIDRP